MQQRKSFCFYTIFSGDCYLIVETVTFYVLRIARYKTLLIQLFAIRAFHYNHFREIRTGMHLIKKWVVYFVALVVSTRPFKPRK